MLLDAAQHRYSLGVLAGFGDLPCCVGWLRSSVAALVMSCLQTRKRFGPTRSFCPAVLRGAPTDCSCVAWSCVCVYFVAWVCGVQARFTAPCRVPGRCEPRRRRWRCKRSRRSPRGVLASGSSSTGMLRRLCRAIIGMSLTMSRRGMLVCQRALLMLLRARRRFFCGRH